MKLKDYTRLVYIKLFLQDYMMLRTTNWSIFKLSCEVPLPTPKLTYT